MAEAQPAGIAVPDGDVYIMPLWPGFMGASNAEFAAEVQNLRNRIGGGGKAVPGFTVTIQITMSDWHVDINDASAVRAALAGTIAQIDAVLSRARNAAVPVTISFLTAIRERVDPVQTAAQDEDRRNIQWYSDNGRADGWLTHSRYARKLRSIQEAYIRELGSVVAERMADDPDIFIAAAGDGEVELSFERTPTPPSVPQSAVLADFSPFAVAEFRDWLRHGGLYAPGQPFAGQGYEQGGRYAGDASPAADTNGDSHTVNGDFGTAFSDWALRFGEWSLGDDPFADPNALPGQQLPADLGLSRFDAPRIYDPASPWWIVWNDFRQQMIWRHNQEFAEWMTTTPSRAAGETIPPERWYSYQIAADFLFGHTPAAPDWRLITSASPWWTADVSPFGSTGITAFNTNAQNGFFGRTLAGVGPEISARGLRWGIIEWNPSVPGSPDLGVYRDEVELVLQHDASLLVPFLWDADPTYRIQDTAFETVLSELAAEVENAQYLTLNRVRLPFAGLSGAASFQSQSSAQMVTVVPQGGGNLNWTVTADQPWIQVSPVSGIGAGTFEVSILDTGGFPASGNFTGTVTVSASGSSNSPRILIELALHSPLTTTGPFGVIDTPLPNIVGVTGSLGVTGWALDDLEVVRVQIFRDPVPPEASGALIYVGDAVMIDGARPDVAAGNTSLPFNTRAGWGFLVLTNMLPNLGNGQYTLHVFAIDAEGLSTLLGSRTFSANNAQATLPFGAIDTPGQGATASGNAFLNFGWVLAQPGSFIPLDGSTITVFVDGVPIGNPDYGHFRPDIATLFSQFPGANQAVGFLPIDTTAYTNGLHTIAWGVADNLGRTTGIGSRFFSVLNPVGSLEAGSTRVSTWSSGDPAPSAERVAAPPSSEVINAIHVRRGYELDAVPHVLFPDKSGVYNVPGEELERIELHLGGAGARISGSMDGDQALPIGSTLEQRAGVFTWQPSVGFIGTYSLNFVRSEKTGTETRIPVRITLAPRYAEQVTPRMAIDLPTIGEVTQPFVIAGWAVDLAAVTGAGVGAVHAWAFPVDENGLETVPIFIGAAQYGGDRPDVGALYGSTFTQSGYGLSVFGLVPGTYDLVVYAFSSVAGDFNNASSRRITVQ